MKYFSRAQAEKEIDKIFREVGEKESKGKLIIRSG